MTSIEYKGGPRIIHKSRRYASARLRTRRDLLSLHGKFAELSEYSKKSFENGSAFFERLLGAKSFESAIQIQSEYAKTFFEELVGYVTKTGELYSDLAKEAFKPIENAITKVQAAKE